MSQTIKGGGRTCLSAASENALIDCLMNRRRPRPSAVDPGENDDDKNNSSRVHQSHALQRERKRFVKKLVASYDRQQVHKQINHHHRDQRTRSTNQALVKNSSINHCSEAPPLVDDVGSSKVRFELSEAIFTLNKEGQASTFKTGPKKLMVLPRSTTVSELLSVAKNKLHMKKTPVRIFMVVLGNTKQHVDLQHGLFGLRDGSVLHVTSSALGSEKGGTDSTEGPVDSDNEECQDGVDPLEAVKQVYAQHHSQSRLVRRGPPSISLPMEHPTFSNHFEKLGPLTSSCAQLPAAHSRHDTLKAIEKHQVVVICGETGCGKSTQVPQFLWQGLRAAGSEYANILVTQPRRIAAIALASRVAEEMDSPPPGKPDSIVGYHVRLDRAVSDTAQLVYCTVGILLRKLVSPMKTDSPMLLSEYTHLIIDEVHERDVNTDFLLTLLRAALPRNPSLRLILMSATTSADLFTQYFEKFQPFVMFIPGRTFPVETMWLDDCQRLAGRTMRYLHEEKDAEEAEGVPLSPRASSSIDYTFIEALTAGIIRQQQERGDVDQDGHRTNGAILIFLPGTAEIEALFRVLINGENVSRCNCTIKVHRLHSGVKRHAQKAIFAPAAARNIKIVLSTNVAETSITIPDASYIVDTGRVKESRYNSSSRLKELVTVWTSQASAKQRAGRAGRTCPGVCYRLYPKSFFDETLLEQGTPEMVRTPLDELVLQVCLLYEQRRKSNSVGKNDGVDPSKLLNQVPEPPSPTSLEQACQHLIDVDALVEVDDHKFRLTPLGFHLSRLPMDPKVGKVLIVGCLLGCADNALTVAAALSCPRPCFFHQFSGKADRQHDMSLDRRAQIIEQGFGGKDWKGGTVKGDFMAVIACFRAWQECPTDQDQFQFARDHALDHSVMKEIRDLRRSFSDMLREAGFCGKRQEPPNHHGEDALLTSACWVAGLYPNICTLMRPRKGGPKGGRLLTKEGDVCRPQTQSFQRSRVQRTAETGKDAYAVYHTKHRSVTTQSKSSEVYVSNVNFVSRYALLLFSGDLRVENNAVIVDGWLKFKIGETGKTGAILLLALRKELDAMLLTQISGGADTGKETNELLSLVRQLLADE